MSFTLDCAAVSIGCVNRVCHIDRVSYVYIAVSVCLLPWTVLPCLWRPCTCGPPCSAARSAPSACSSCTGTPRCAGTPATRASPPIVRGGC